LYDNIIESLSRVKNRNSGFGCILAHSMGLGKRFQTVSFTDIFLRYTGCKRVLCIVPINTIQNWLSEFNYWLPENNMNINYKREFNVLLLNDNFKTFNQRTQVVCKFYFNIYVLF
jgi:RAD54-like protein 2